MEEIGFAGTISANCRGYQNTSIQVEMRNKLAKIGEFRYSKQGRMVFAKKKKKKGTDNI